MLAVCAEKDQTAVEAQRDAVYAQFDKNREKVLEALSLVAVTPVGTAQGGGGGGGGARLNVNKSLKPFTLLPTHSPTEYKHWAKLFRAYFRTSHMDTIEAEDQQVYVQSCVDPILWGRIQHQIRLDSPALDDGFRKSITAMLEDDFTERYPAPAAIISTPWSGPAGAAGFAPAAGRAAVTSSA